MTCSAGPYGRRGECLASPFLGGGLDGCSGYAVLRGEKAPDDALARELGAMGLL
jgi:hypothetical protein